MICMDLPVWTSPNHKELKMKEIKAAVEEKTFEKDGKVFLACHSAHVIAEELQVKLSAIGKICNDEKIRISKCQLGCFE